MKQTKLQSLNYDKVTTELPISNPCSLDLILKPQNKLVETKIVKISLVKILVQLTFWLLL